VMAPSSPALSSRTSSPGLSESDAIWLMGQCSSDGFPCSASCEVRPCGSQWLRIIGRPWRSLVQHRPGCAYVPARWSPSIATSARGRSTGRAPPATAARRASPPYKYPGPAFIRRRPERLRAG
jgi:hypothetical protein